MFKNNTSVVDDRGYNQGFKETLALQIRMRRRARWIIKELQTDKRKRILEIGCGTGYISYFIAQQTGMNVTGSDICQPFVQKAKEVYKVPNLTYKVLDFNDAATEIDTQFDYIIGNGILHHLYYQLDKALINLKKLLRPAGKIIFMEPNIYNPYITAIFKNKALRKWAKLEPDEMAFSKSFIINKLENAAFKNIKVTYKDFLLPGTPRLFIGPLISIGNVLEKTPLKIISQSILISAEA